MTKNEVNKNVILDLPSISVHCLLSRWCWVSLLFRFLWRRLCCCLLLQFGYVVTWLHIMTWVIKQTLSFFFFQIACPDWPLLDLANYSEQEGHHPSFYALEAEGQRTWPYFTWYYISPLQNYRHTFFKYICLCVLANISKKKTTKLLTMTMTLSPP